MRPTVCTRPHHCGSGAEPVGDGLEGLVKVRRRRHRRRGSEHRPVGEAGVHVGQPNVQNTDPGPAQLAANGCQPGAQRTFGAAVGGHAGLRALYEHSRDGCDGPAFGQKRKCGPQDCHRSQSVDCHEMLGDRVRRVMRTAEGGCSDGDDHRVDSGQGLRGPARQRSAPVEIVAVELTGWAAVQRPRPLCEALGVPPRYGEYGTPLVQDRGERTPEHARRAHDQYFGAVEVHTSLLCMSRGRPAGMPCGRRSFRAPSTLKPPLFGTVTDRLLPKGAARLAEWCCVALIGAVSRDSCAARRRPDAFSRGVHPGERPVRRPRAPRAGLATAAHTKVCVKEPERVSRSGVRTAGCTG